MYNSVMLTRKKRTGIDSSPKTSLIKNVHLLSSETMADTVNVLSTPTRRNRFLGNTHANIMNDDSPVLSQESINISWKWNNEGTPIRSASKSSKLRRSITKNSAQYQNLQRLSSNRNNADNQNGIPMDTSSPKPMADPETHSPKGLYKFQEEMKKIQFDNESDTSCDNFNDKSMTADTGYPTNMEGTVQPDIQRNVSSCSSSSRNNNNRINDGFHTERKDNQHISMTATSQTNEKHGIDEMFADDLLNDSDFDQMLLTCKMPAQKKPEKIEATRTIEKKASSSSEIKPGSSNSSGSNWDLIGDDCFDDLMKDFDEDIPNTSSKFTRHKSMPQQPKSPSTTNINTFVPQQSTVGLINNVNRKSFIRHESMPITNSSTINRSSVTNHNNNNSVSQNTGLSSTQLRKCTSEEIAEKRRIAMERLKNRKQQNSKT